MSSVGVVVERPPFGWLVLVLVLVLPLFNRAERLLVITHRRSP